MTQERQLIKKDTGELIPISELALTLADTMELGKVLQESGFFPGITNKAQAVAKIMAGRELGLGPVYSLQMIDLVQGRLRLRSEVMAALINKSVHYSYMVGTLTEHEAVIEFSKDGKSVYIAKFTMEDAKRANLLKPDSGWLKYPKDMLFARALSTGAKKVCPELMMGMETLEGEGLEVVEGHVVKEGEPPPSAWQFFWGEIEERGFSEEEVHKILGVASVKEWLKQGKSLGEALQVLSDKKGKEAIESLFGPEEPQKPSTPPTASPGGTEAPKASPGPSSKATTKAPGEEKRVFPNAGAWAEAVRADGGDVSAVMIALNLRWPSDLKTQEDMQAAWQTHLNLKKELEK